MEPGVSRVRIPVEPVMYFFLSSVIFGFCLVLWAWLLWVGQRQFPDFARQLPRNRILGELVGIITLCWAAYHVCGMLEGGLAAYRLPVKLLVPVVAVLAYGNLDYLFARAFGGFLLLVANFLIHEGFAVNVPCRPVYSLTCYLVGVTGLILVAAPWKLRDLLVYCSRNRSGRLYWSGGVACVGGILVIFGLLVL